MGKPRLRIIALGLGVVAAAVLPTNSAVATTSMGNDSTVAGASTASAAGADPSDFPAVPVHYRVDTLTRVAKLGSDLAIGAGTLDGTFTIIPGTPLRVEVAGDLALPPAPSYFVTFRFMPATATTTVIVTAPVRAELVNGVLTSTIHLVFQLSQVRVQQVPLDVGPNCRSDEAVIQQSGPFASPLSTGTISGTFTIPPFHHCGATENLDPLFDGLVSGPGNAIHTDLTFRCGGTPTCGPTA
jgi:hypothetical protein